MHERRYFERNEKAGDQQNGEKCENGLGAHENLRGWLTAEGDSVPAGGVLPGRSLVLAIKARELPT